MRRRDSQSADAVWHRQTFAVFLLLLQFVSVAGCGDSSGRSANETESSIFKNLVLNYVDQVHKNQGRVPKNMQALSTEFEKRFREYLTENNMNVEQLLISPRDGKPYVFVTQENSNRGKSRVAGYEMAGVNGVRYVGLMSGDVFEVDETGFRDMVPNQ